MVITSDEVTFRELSSSASIGSVNRCPGITCNGKKDELEVAFKSNGEVLISFVVLASSYCQFVQLKTSLKLLTVEFP